VSSLAESEEGAAALLMNPTASSMKPKAALAFKVVSTSSPEPPGERKPLAGSDAAPSRGSEGPIASFHRGHSSPHRAADESTEAASALGQRPSGPLPKQPTTGDRLEKPTDFSVPGKAKLIKDDVQERFADRLEKPTDFTPPGKTKLKGDKVEEDVADKLENPTRHASRISSNEKLRGSKD